MRAAVVTVILCGVFTSPLDAQRRAELMRLVNRTVSGTVTSVTDGDSVRIRLDGTSHTIPVRLEGIDAPETGEPFSNQARNAARVLMFDKNVQVMARDVDNYDRLVARVIVAGKDASLELLQAGLACHLPASRTIRCWRRGSSTPKKLVRDSGPLGRRNRGV